MTQRFAPGCIAIALTTASFVLLAGCNGGGAVRRPINTPGATPPATAPGASTDSVQALYESGRYQDVVNSVNAGERSPQAIWFAAQSSLRLGQRAEASSFFAQLPSAGGSPAWQVVADLALALLRDDAGEIDRAREAAAALPGDPYVQYNLASRTLAGTTWRRPRKPSIALRRPTRDSRTATTTAGSHTTGSIAQTSRSSG